MSLDFQNASTLIEDEPGALKDTDDIQSDITPQDIAMNVAISLAAQIPKKNRETLRRAARFSTLLPVYSRNSRLPACSTATLDTRYMLDGEDYQDCFMRSAKTMASNIGHAERMYFYISNQWFTPATPNITNLGAPSGLPISCFLNEVIDSMEGIVDTWTENVWLGVNGGGTGSYWGQVRSINENIGKRGKTSGVVPFLRVSDAMTLAISQGGQRRAMNASYLPIWHPEIEEFIDIRRPTGGDPNRKALNLHHGVAIPDEFMVAVANDDMWDLVSPKTGEVIRSISARGLWIRLLTARMEQGEPYILNVGPINNMMPWYQKAFGLTIKMSNLCCEITLPTGLDYLNNMRTAVCCLGSINLEYAHEFMDNDQFWEDVFEALDNILDIFIADAPEFMKNAVYSAMRERSIGLGFMGWHDFLQQRGIPFESVKAMAWARRIDNIMRAQADRVSYKLAQERGPCPDAADAGVMERFACKLSIAPTASISLIAGGVSPGCETKSANVFLQKTNAGSIPMRNRYLSKVLANYGMDTQEVWASITYKKGSVQHLPNLTEEEKEVYKTAHEIDHTWTVRQAALRTGVCQSQSINLFLPADIHKRDLHAIHYLAWKRGVKSLYYCRSLSISRAESPEDEFMKSIGQAAVIKPIAPVEKEYEECLSCQ